MAIIVDLYVDASTVPRNPGHVGLGVAGYINGCFITTWAYAGMGTSNRGELLAIGLALSSLDIDHRATGRITTDSQYAYYTISGEWSQAQHPWLISEIRKKLVADYPGLLLDWVPGHSGDEGNEAADFAARQAAIMGRDSCCPVFDMVSGPVMRMLERDVLPNVRRFKPEWQKVFLSLHKKVVEGSRVFTPLEAQLIIETTEGL